MNQILSILFISFPFFILAQSDQSDLMSYDSLRVEDTKQYMSLGYSYNIVDSDEREMFPDRTANHFAELSFVKGRGFANRHPNIVGYSAGSYFGIYGMDDFIVGPKLSASVCVMGMYLGSELVYFTNFDGYQLSYIPTFGMGYEGGSITFRPIIALSENNFEQLLNKGSISLAYPIFLKR